MLKSRIYLDTSVPSAYFDERTPERQQLTREFWSKIRRGVNLVNSQNGYEPIEIIAPPEL